MYSKADGMYSRADDMYSRADDTYSKADDMCSRADDMYSRADDMYSKADGMYSRADDMYSRADDTYSRADDMCSRADGICSRVEHASMYCTYQNRLYTYVYTNTELCSKALQHSGCPSKPSTPIQRCKSFHLQFLLDSIYFTHIQRYYLCAWLVNWSS